MELKPNEVIMTNEDQYPFVILRGESANLSGLRSVDTQASFLSQREQPLLISTAIPCRISIPGTDEIVSTLEGQIFVTSSQILFVAKEDVDKDWAIGAACIVMHAMAEEPELSIYLQLQEEGEQSETIEITIIPMNPDTSQSIFDALCKLVSLHPIEDDDDDNEAGGQFFVQDDFVCAPLAFGDGEDEEERGATEEARQAMLDHLDSLLVVRPDLEIVEGQFDDAEEELGS